MCNLAGGLYISNGKTWNVQWADGGSEYMDLESPEGRPHMEVGAQGAVYRIIGNALRTHPLLWHHGTSDPKMMDTEESFYTSAKVMSDVYRYRAALKKLGRKPKAGVPGDEIPKVKGEVEWCALTGGRELCLVMANTKSEPQYIDVTVKDRTFFAPNYYTVSCDEKFIDCREIPGQKHLWHEEAWEDTQFGNEVLCMEAYKGLKPQSDVLHLEIAPHTCQAVTAVMKNIPPPKK